VLPTLRRVQHADLLRNMVAFCDLLRQRDLRVSPAEVIDALNGAGSIDLADRDELKLALRTVLTTRPEDLPVFDASFDEFWCAQTLEGGDDHFSTRERAGRGQGQALPQTSQQNGTADSPPDETVAGPVSSPIELLAQRNFNTFQPDQLADIRRAVLLLARRLATRASRRYRVSRHGTRIDLRRTFRRNMQYGGTVVELAYKRRAIRKQRIVLICDVSRSMETYSTFLLQFIYAFQHTLGKVESFVFSTRLTRVTDYFGSSDIYTALDRLAREVPDWAGGTRIGDSLHVFNRRWAPRVLNHRTVVVVLSDGLDAGHWSVLEHEMDAIERRAARVIWLNPLLGNHGYRPVARGMSAALPHVSVFASAHNLATLRDLAQQLTP
jgi:uncharacterized protein